MYTVLLNRELFLHLVLFLDLKVKSLFPTKKQNLKATWFTVSNAVAKNNCISQTSRHLKTIIKEHVSKVCKRTYQKSAKNNQCCTFKSYE